MYSFIRVSVSFVEGQKVVKKNEFILASMKDGVKRNIADEKKRGISDKGILKSFAM